MGNRKHTISSLSQEDLREALESGRHDLAGLVELDMDALLNSAGILASQKYISTPCFAKLLINADNQVLARLSQLNSAYATGLTLESARSACMSLLRIPAPQRRLTDAPSDTEQTADELETLRRGARAAASVASTVQRVIKQSGAPPSLEVVTDLIHQAAKSTGAEINQVRTHLAASRIGAPLLTLRDNTQLPPVAPMPKSLHSEHTYDVIARINGLIDPAPHVEVFLTNMAGQTKTPAALQGLMNVPLKASFIPDRIGRIRRTLLSAQLAEKTVKITVEVTRSFRNGDEKHNTISICKIHSDAELAAAMSEISTQLGLDL